MSDAPRQPLRHVAVIDIGKTNAKLALVDTDRMEEIAVATRPNTSLTGGAWRSFDLDGIWDFLLGALADMQAAHGIDAISVTTHGASAVLLDDSGALACPMLDYEETGPDDVADEYDALRPGFEITGSPRLPMGLNLGAQLHWLLEGRVERDRIAQIVTYPQFWSGRLTGRYGCELTSLGCHTDLWDPRAGTFSPLVDRLGLSGRMAPVVRAGDPAGAVLPDLAARIGLPEGILVFSGIHDSNASLLPHLRNAGPFSVVSTGTWVIAMSMGAEVPALDPARDTLINVNALGQPVPSARFMGGREYEREKGAAAAPSASDRDAVLAGGALLRPSVEPASGPFPGRSGGWTAEPATEGERSVALGYYLALMTAECLALTHGAGPIIVEGPFARNADYLAMLGAATGREVRISASATGTSIGAALLARPEADLPVPVPVGGAADPRLAAYAARWRETP
ncbi:FGGY-family carbohydrate kinase [Wenxinia saemankumensis]|uniref:Sugar (Pentulose or hexulose) kinase n=1 Tax=Wenxinia saemankumensis TaxID=1447782 RepID=A0A1M6DX95_9RHOB|nr:FGGY-family carbohydrate kinase [Wenxinia saemankumensis]SHI77884.1 Sugar (pentulose or hexulose) kinase [Wenxinia saemankumensis]